MLFRCRGFEPLTKAKYTADLPCLLLGHIKYLGIHYRIYSDEGNGIGIYAHKRHSGISIFLSARFPAKRAKKYDAAPHRRIFRHSYSTGHQSTSPQFS